MAGTDHSVGRLIRRLVPSGVACASWQPEDGPLEADLHEVEAEAIRQAVPSRRLEFAHGRACAREAMRRLGLPPAPIPVGPKREPLWPAGVVGSISHCRDAVAAVLAPTDRLGSIGLDIEAAQPLEEDVRRIVAGELRAPRTPLDGTQVFSAKEAVFKATFPALGVWLDFDDVRIGLESPGRFTVHPVGRPTAVARFLEGLEGVRAVSGTHVVTLCYSVTDGRERRG